MGNLCGSPSKDRDYEDHNGLDRKGIRAEKLNKVSEHIYISIQFVENNRVIIYHKRKWKS